MAELERVVPRARGELVDQELAEQRRLRHAEAAEGAGDAVVGEHGTRQRAHVRHAVRAAGVDRHPVGDGRAPRRVGAGVEVAGEVEGEQPAVAVARRAGAHLGRMALGARLHRLGPLVDQAHRPAELPGRDRDERLHREVELAAEAAADRRRHDVHLLGRDLQDAGELVAVHVGRLGAGEDADAAQRCAASVAAGDDLGVAGLGLDVGVLDVARRERAFDDARGAGERGVDVAAHDPAAAQHVVGIARVQRRAAIGGGERGGDRFVRGERQVADRHLGVGDRLHRRRVADQRQHGLAAKAGDAVGEHRLVAQVGEDRKGVVRHVGGADDVDQSRPARLQLAQVADLEPGVRVRRADHAQRQHGGRAGLGPGVGAEALGAVDLGWRIEAGGAAADSAAACRRRHVDDGSGSNRQHRLDDLAVAGAAAQHARERLLDLGLARPRVRAQQRLGAHQHSGRADAALRRAVGDEGALQDRERAIGLGEALDRRHRAPGALADGDDARADLLAVEQHGAGAAVAGVAADLGAGEAELVAQGIREAPRGVAGELARGAVDAEANDVDRGQVARGHATISRRARRSSVAVASRR